MGKIFKVTGTYSDKPNSSFEGIIVVGKNGSFKGYCGEKDGKEQVYQFLCGDFGRSLLLMSNTENCLPVLYMVHNRTNGEWATNRFSIVGDYARIAGDATIQFEQIDYDPELAEQLCALYNEVDLQAEWNRSYTVNYYTKNASVIAC